MRIYRARSYRSKKRPHLKFVVNSRQNGKRARSFFETQKAAKSFAQLKNNELFIGETEGAKQLAAYGKTIADGIEFICRTLRPATGHAHSLNYSLNLYQPRRRMALARLTSLICDVGSGNSRTASATGSCPKSKLMKSTDGCVT